MVKLFIDTSNNKKVEARLEIDDKKYSEFSTPENLRPESILILIDKVCTKANITSEQIDEINVKKGPGSYTGLKVGASVANALSFALSKKVNGTAYGDLIEPTYE